MFKSISFVRFIFCVVISLLNEFWLSSMSLTLKNVNDSVSIILIPLVLKKLTELHPANCLETHQLLKLYLKKQLFPYFKLDVKCKPAVSTTDLV